MRLVKVLQNFGFLLIVNFVILGSVMLSDLNAAEISYQGTSKCEGMQVEVTFILDKDNGVVKSFKAQNECIEGEGLSYWQPEVDIKVDADGGFNFKDDWGNFVEGKILSDGKASGKFSKGNWAFQCKKDGVSYHKCTAWEAVKKIN